jgi:hypothetical protein
MASSSNGPSLIKVRAWMEEEIGRTGVKGPKQAATSLANRAADHFGEMDAEGGASAAYVKLAKQVVSAHVEDKGGTYPTVGMRVRWTTGGQQYSGTVTARKGKQVVVAYYLGGGKPITATLDVSDLMNPRS